MKRYVILHEEDGNFWVEVPSLPGCFGQGETREAALEDIKLAIAQHIETLRAHGDPIPEEFEYSVVEL